MCYRRDDLEGKKKRERVHGCADLRRFNMVSSAIERADSQSLTGSYLACLSQRRIAERHRRVSLWARDP